MCETSWLAGASVNGYSDINDISNITEEPVEVGIGHLKGKIANEQSLGRWVGFALAGGLGHVVHDEAAAFKDGLVLGFDSSSGLLSRLEFDITKSVPKLSAIDLNETKSG
jgi:hypothetical protein